MLSEESQSGILGQESNFSPEIKRSVWVKYDSSWLQQNSPFFGLQNEIKFVYHSFHSIFLQPIDRIHYRIEATRACSDSKKLLGTGIIWRYLMISSTKQSFFCSISSLGRILTGCYWFCILIMISTYTANLAAFLVVKDNDNPINNLEDIVRSTYQVAVIESGSTYEAFRTSQYVTHEKIWNRMVTAGSFVQSTAEGIQMVRDRDQFVFISDGPVLKHAAQQPPCDVTTGQWRWETHREPFTISLNNPDFFIKLK